MLISMRALALFALLSPGPALALDQNDAQALAQTQALMNDQQALAAFAKDNPNAINALNQVNQLTAGNPQQGAELKAISSSVFGDIAKKTNGDPVAIQAQLQNALKDPGAFMKTLSPEQQARINSLAADIDKQNAARSPASK